MESKDPQTIGIVVALLVGKLVFFFSSRKVLNIISYQIRKGG